MRKFHFILDLDDYSFTRFSFNGILTERSFNLETIARSVNSVTSNFVERNRWNGNRPVNVLINRPSRTAVNLAPCMQFTIILRNLPWETGQGNWPLAIEKLVGSSNLRVFGRKFRLKGKKKKKNSSSLLSRNSMRFEMRLRVECLPPLPPPQQLMRILLWGFLLISRIFYLEKESRILRFFELLQRQRVAIYELRK